MQIFCSGRSLAEHSYYGHGRADWTGQVEEAVELMEVSYFVLLLFILNKACSQGLPGTPAWQDDQGDQGEYRRWWAG